MGTAERPRFVTLGRGPEGVGGAVDGVRRATLSDMVLMVEGAGFVEDWKRRGDGRFQFLFIYFHVMS